MALIDGYSRYLVHYEIRTSVEALDLELLLEHAREKFPGVTPILITDNGPQFVAKDFKSYLSFVGITHRRTRAVSRGLITCPLKNVSSFSM